MKKICRFIDPSLDIPEVDFILSVSLLLVPDYLCKVPLEPTNIT